MAGMAKRRADAEAIRARWDEMLAELAEGKSLRNACIAMGFASESGLLWLMKQDSTLAEEVAHARKQGAAALASSTLDLADDLAEFALVDPIKSTEQRIKTRQWMAAKLDRETYGDNNKQTVQVNIGSLHLDALRRPGSIPSQPALEHDVIEGEIVQPAIKLDDIL